MVQKGTHGAPIQSPAKRRYRHPTKQQICVVRVFERKQSEQGPERFGVNITIVRHLDTREGQVLVLQVWVQFLAKVGDEIATILPDAPTAHTRWVKWTLIAAGLNKSLPRAHCGEPAFFRRKLCRPKTGRGQAHERLVIQQLVCGHYKDDSTHLVSQGIAAIARVTQGERANIASLVFAIPCKQVEAL